MRLIGCAYAQSTEAKRPTRTARESMTNFENIQTATVHAGRVRKLRADFTESGYVEWATADCEKGAAYRNVNRMQLVETDADVTCKRCLALTAPAKPVEGFALDITINGFRERFRNVKTATTALVTHLADHEALGYRLDADAVAALKSAVEISEDELAKKVAAKVKRYQRDMQR